MGCVHDGTHNRIVQRLPRPSGDAGFRACRSDAIDLRQLQDFFWRRWKVILGDRRRRPGHSPISCCWRSPRAIPAPRKSCSSRKKNNILGAELRHSPGTSASRRGNVDSQVSVIRSTNLLRRVVEQDQLTQDLEFGAAAPPGPVLDLLDFLIPRRSRRRQPAPGSSDLFRPTSCAPSGACAVRSMSQRVQRTYVISIAVTSEDPAKAARLANAVADAYVVDQLDARYDAAKRAADWLARAHGGHARARSGNPKRRSPNFRREHNLARRRAKPS